MTRVIIFMMMFAMTARIMADDHVVKSPDSRLAVTVTAAGDGTLTYAFAADQETLINPSPMGLEFNESRKMPGPYWSVAKIATRSVDEVWKPLWGKRAVVPDR